MPQLTVAESAATYQVIERYPQSQASWFLPSYLVYAERSGEIVHVLFAIDREGDNVRVITVYRPDTEEWEPGFLRRRQS